MGTLQRYRPMRGVRRRGFGQTPDVTSTIQYLGVVEGQPADQTGVNQMIATPVSAQQLAQLSLENAQYFGSQQGLGPFTPQPGTQGTIPATQWLNQNALTIVIGTAAFLIAWKAFSK
jgi:hypothetical protein